MNKSKFSFSKINLKIVLLAKQKKTHQNLKFKRIEKIKIYKIAQFSLKN
jgi:hypothetical protein